MTLEGAVAQAGVHDWVFGHPPGSATAASAAQERKAYSQFLQGLEPSFGAMPSLPKAFAHVPPYPTVLPKQWLAIARQPVVLPPAAKIPPPLIAELAAVFVLSAIPKLAHSITEFLNGFFAHFDHPFRAESKPQKLSFPGPIHSAFARADFQLELFGHELCGAFQNPLGRFLAADVNIAIIRIAAEAQSTFFQFLVQHIQID